MPARGPRRARSSSSIAYAVSGALAQFGRGPIVQVFARELAETTGRTLEARLRRKTAAAPSERLTVGALMLRALWRRLSALFVRRTD